MKKGHPPNTFCQSHIFDPVIVYSKHPCQGSRNIHVRCFVLSDFCLLFREYIIGSVWIAVGANI